MFFWTRRYLWVKWRSVKQAAVTVKHRIQRTAGSNKTKVVRTTRKIRNVNNSARRTAKNAIITSLPGVSKIKLPESPVPQLLVSNEPPTESESILITQAIEAAQVNAVQWTTILAQRRKNGQLRRTWEIVTTHKIEQANLFVLRHKRLLSAGRRLPMEILQEVFLWTAQDTRHTDSQWRPNRMLPWLLGQICRHWRIVALSTTSLWDHLPTAYLTKSRKTTKLQIQCLSELLRRSKGVPLDFCIDGFGFNEETHQVVDLLCLHAERWEHVSIISAVQVWAGLRSIKGRLLALKSLIFSALTVLESLSGTIDYFESAPQLSTVCLARPLQSKIALPFARLVHYTENLILGNQLSPAICSPQLQTLSVIARAEGMIFPIATIPCLVALYVDFLYNLEVSNCFDNLTLPAIEHITILYSYGNLMPSLTHMLSNSSSCPLKTLFLRIRMEDNELSTLLSLTPALIGLNVSLPASDTDILNLASGYQNQRLVPRLEVCEFYVDDYEAVSRDVAKALNLLASSRCELDSNAVIDNLSRPGVFEPLKSLSIHFDGLECSHLQLAHFENWATTSTSEELQYLRAQLYAKCPELSYRYNRSPENSTRIWNDQTGEVLRLIESVEVKDAKEIYVSRIHYTLKKISDEWSSGYGGSLANSILLKWQPMMEENMSERHWAFEGESTLVYIANNSALRTSSEDAMSVVYGVKEYSPPASLYRGTAPVPKYFFIPY